MKTSGLGRSWVAMVLHFVQLTCSFRQKVVTVISFSLMLLLLVSPHNQFCCFGNSLVHIGEKCPSIAKGTCEEPWSLQLHGSGTKQKVEYKYKAKGQDESYFARCFNGGFFKNTGFTLLPVDYDNGGRNCLTTWEPCISTSTPSYSSPTWAPRGVCYEPSLHVGTPPLDATMAPRPQQLLQGDRSCSKNSATTSRSKKSNFKRVKKYFWWRQMVYFPFTSYLDS